MNCRYLNATMAAGLLLAVATLASSSVGQSTDPNDLVPVQRPPTDALLTGPDLGWVNTAALELDFNEGTTHLVKPLGRQPCGPLQDLYVEPTGPVELVLDAQSPPFDVSSVTVARASTPQGPVTTLNLPGGTSTLRSEYNGLTFQMTVPLDKTGYIVTLAGLGGQSQIFQAGVMGDSAACGAS